MMEVKLVLNPLSQFKSHTSIETNETLIRDKGLQVLHTHRAVIKHQHIPLHLISHSLFFTDTLIIPRR